MSEATLKTKWRKHAAKHGVWTKSLSPHQIPGCPDIVAMDCAASDIVRELVRTRTHWIEAKVAGSGPTTFRVDRDPTAAQVQWIRELGLLGGSTWWLVLGEKKWLLVPWHRDEVSREEFQRKSKIYGAPPIELFEPETKRKEFLQDTARALQDQRLEIARMFAGKKRKR